MKPLSYFSSERFLGADNFNRHDQSAIYLPEKGRYRATYNWCNYWNVFQMMAKLGPTQVKYIRGYAHVNITL